MIKIKIGMCGHPNIGWISGLNTQWQVDFKDITPLTDYNIFDDYNMIFLYLISGYKTAIPWTKQAVVLKQTYPNKPLMIFFDYEASRNPDIEWRETFQAADLIVHCNLLENLGAWQEYARKCLFTPIPVQIEGLYNYHPFVDSCWTKEKIKWIAILQHTNPFADLRPALENLGKINGASIKFFTGWHNIDKPESHEFVAKTWGIEHCKAFKRLEPKDYLKELSECYLAYDNCGLYVGWSRFVYESAAYFIPTVSNMNITANRIANPELCSEDPFKHIEHIKRLLNNVQLRDEYGKRAYETLKYYCDVNTVNNRLVEKFKQLGLKL